MIRSKGHVVIFVRFQDNNGAWDCSLLQTDVGELAVQIDTKQCTNDVYTVMIKDY